MKKIMVLFLLGLSILVACGVESKNNDQAENKINVDIAKTKQVVADRAMKQSRVSKGNYSKNDIEIKKVCEAIDPRYEDFGFDGDYKVFWQTSDGEVKYEFMMTSDYEVNLGASKYDKVEDRCISIK